MIDPTMFIAPFTLGYALFIVFLYVAVRTRKKILEEGRHLRGIPTLMGLLAFFDMMFLIMSGIFLFLDFLYLGFFILPVLILGPLIIAFIANSKIKKEERIEYEVVHMKMSGIEAVGIIGPILVILGCLMLTGSIFSKIFYIGYFTSIIFPILFTSIFTIVGFVGVILGGKRKYYGCYFCLVAGIFLTIGMFISIPSVSYFPIYLTQALYSDPYFVLVGGILSVISGKNFLSYYSKKHEFTDNVINIEDEIDKIEDLKGFLQERLGSDWEKIKLSLEAYQAGELDKKALIRTAIKNIGDKFIEIFKPNKRGELNEV